MGKWDSKNVVTPHFNEGVQTIQPGSVLLMQTDKKENSPEEVRKRRYVRKSKRHHRFIANIKTGVAILLSFVCGIVFGSNTVHLLDIYSTSGILNDVIGVQIAIAVFMLVYFTAMDFIPSNEAALENQAIADYHIKRAKKNMPNELI